MERLGGFSETTQEHFYVLTEASSKDALEVATEFMFQKYSELTFHGFGLVVKDWHKASGSNLTHVYVKQTFLGVEIVNGDANLNVDQHGRIVSFFSTFYSSVESPQHSSQTVFVTENREENISVVDALNSFAEYSNLAMSVDSDIKASSAVYEKSIFPGSRDVPERVETIVNVPFASEGRVLGVEKYLIIPDKDNGFKLASVWDLSIHMAKDTEWLNVQVDSISGAVQQVISWASDYAVDNTSLTSNEIPPKKPSGTYRVYTLEVNDPTEGNRSIVTNVADETASPLGWHSQGEKQFTSTIGNNVYAQVKFRPFSQLDFITCTRYLTKICHSCVAIDLAVAKALYLITFSIALKLERRSINSEMHP